MLSYRNRVMQVARGQIKPDRKKPFEWMLFDTFQLMKSTDEALAKDLIEGFCALLQAQTTEDRMSVKHLGPYLKHREVDVGRTWVPNYLSKIYLELTKSLAFTPRSSDLVRTCTSAQQSYPKPPHSKAAPFASWASSMTSTAGTVNQKCTN